MLATDYAKYYNIAPQGKDESDSAFRGRVSGELRDAGHIIEAHEVFNDERYEQSDNVMSGIIGAMAQALQGVNYGSKGEHQVGDDFACGEYVKHHKEQDPAMLLMALLLADRR